MDWFITGGAALRDGALLPDLSLRASSTLPGYLRPPRSTIADIGFAVLNRR